MYFCTVSSPVIVTCSGIQDQRRLNELENCHEFPVSDPSTAGGKQQQQQTTKMPLCTAQC